MCRYAVGASLHPTVNSAMLTRSDETHGVYVNLTQEKVTGKKALRCCQ